MQKAAVLSMYNILYEKNYTNNVLIKLSQSIQYLLK